MIVVAALLAQVLFPTPSPIATASPPIVSERGLLEQGVSIALAHAARLDATLGVSIYDLTTGVSYGVNDDNDFPLASVFKLPMALVAYDRIDRGELHLDQMVPIEASDVMTHYSNVGVAYGRGQHQQTLRTLLDSMLENSDNTSANVVYRLLGGSASIEKTLVDLGFGDIVIRTDELGLATDAAAGRDFAHGGDNAASPLGIARLLESLQRGSVLSATSRAALLSAMRRAQTGQQRILAGLPAHTSFAHKTGSGYSFGDRVDATNDAGIASIGGHTVAIVAFLRSAKGSEAQQESVLADVGRAVTAAVLPTH